MINIKPSVIYSLFLILLSILSASSFALTLDGQLDEPEWAEAEVQTNFVTVSPFSLDAPKFRTETRILTNEEGIYIGFTNDQPIEIQQTNRTARDQNINADINTVVIDFDNTAISAYHFEVGNGGSMRDGIWRNETSLTNEWNGLWQARTSSDEEHWYSEFFIPWDVAPMLSSRDEERLIGLHFSRTVADNSEQYSSAPIHSSRQRFMSEFNTTTIKDYSGSSLQVFAYTTARQDRILDKNTYDAGVDIFWKPSASNQLSVSINPDFGQVEADDLVVNFSPTEVFFSENRPFFTENQAIFDLSGANSLRILHTRRIGSKPDVGPEPGADILAAVKFTSVGENLNYGFLSAIEASDAVAEGRNYYAGRAVRKTDDYSIGYLLTYADRPDIDREAIVQAVDYLYNFTEKIQLNGQLINTSIDSPLRDFSDNGGWFSVQQQVSDTWTHSIQMSYYGDNFEVNDLGFLRRNNLRTVNYSTTFQDFTFAGNSPIQRNQISADIFHSENAEGEHLNTSLNFSDSLNFVNTSNANLNISLFTGGTDDLITRGNGNLNTESGGNMNVIFFADQRNNFQWHLRGNYFNETVDGEGYFIHFHPSYQFSDRFQLRVGSTYTNSKDWLLWQNGTQLNTFDQERLLTEIEFSANFSRKQEFSLKFEWIALQATGREAFMVDGAGDLHELNVPVESFNLSNVALQLHYRYEIAPLSNIYVVYSRGGRATTEGESAFSDLFSPGWEARTGDNFIVKVRYQF